MPVCLLLRVHSTGPGELDGTDAVEQLVEHDPDLEARRGSRRGSDACRGRSRGAGWDRGARSKRNGSSNTRSSRFADASQNTTLSPARITRPASVTVRVAVRRLYDGGMRPSHDLLDRGRHHRPVVAQTRELIGEFDQRDDRARDRVARRVGARGPQQREEELQLRVGELGRILAVEPGVARRPRACRRRVRPACRRSARCRTRTSTRRRARPRRSSRTPPVRP